jgi:hypothetical protein
LTGHYMPNGCRITGRDLRRLLGESQWLRNHNQTK